MKTLLTILTVISLIILVSTLFFHSHSGNLKHNESNCPICVLIRTFQGILFFQPAYMLALQVLLVLIWTITLLYISPFIVQTQVRAPPTPTL